MQALRKRPLTIREVLDWASRHKETTGKWPTQDSGDIPGSHGETWLRVDAALRYGHRGLPGGSSLRRLLAEKFGARNIKALPDLSEQQILSWADNHHQRTGAWPSRHSGTIPDTTGDNWQQIETALRQGERGLNGGSSLARLLAEHRGVRNKKQFPRLTEEQILAWADAHRERTGKWPTRASGPIADAPGETWQAVEMGLYRGQRGFPGGSSLAQLLTEKRDARNAWTRPDFSREQILE
jgi:hypothetical protein